MGWACSTYGSHVYKILDGSLKGRDSSEDLIVDGIRLKYKVK
jgi:hypothetical protein